MKNEALENLKVVDLSWVVAGPTIGRVLADYGSTVIQVQSTKRIDPARKIGPFYGEQQGVQHSSVYGNVNAGKLGLTIDMTERRITRNISGFSSLGGYSNRVVFTRRDEALGLGL